MSKLKILALAAALIAVPALAWAGDCKCEKCECTHCKDGKCECKHDGKCEGKCDGKSCDTSCDCHKKK